MKKFSRRMTSSDVKYELRKKYAEQERIISSITEKFAKQRGLILYGGLAIDLHLKKVNHTGIYNATYDRIDYDFFSLDYDRDSKDLAAELINNGIKKIRIVSNITGSTRKLFIDLDSESYIDISDINKAIHNDLPIDQKYKNLEPTNINDLLVADVHYLKIDQYQNLCTNLFDDYFRLNKAHSRLVLLESKFPVNSSIVIRTINSQMSNAILFQNPYEVFGGDFAYNYLLNKTFTGEYEVIKPTTPMFYVSARCPLTDNFIKIVSPHYLLWELYKKRFENVHTDMLKMIEIKISSILKICTLDFTDEFHVLVPPMKKPEKLIVLPTLFIEKINNEIKYMKKCKHTF